MDRIIGGSPTEKNNTILLKVDITDKDKYKIIHKLLQQAFTELDIKAPDTAIAMLYDVVVNINKKVKEKQLDSIDLIELASKHQEMLRELWGIDKQHLNYFG